MNYSAARLPAIAAIAPADWNRLALRGPEPAFGPAGNPFVSHAFLSALETSGSAVPAAGWTPHHLVLSDESGEAAAVAPCYLKSHSRGEYVFDQGWAEAFERAGGRYYPKLLCAVPFTPATGPRLIGRDAEASGALAQALAAEAGGLGVSSAHVTFMSETEARLAAACGYLLRTDQQFHFDNPGYRDFADFLDALSSRKRKNIRKERETALRDGVEIAILTGRDLTEAVWDRFFEFYMDTGSRKWGRPYLTREFYSRIGAAMADRIFLVMARRGGRYIAGAINFLGDGVLYGRHWGAVEDRPCLHFEVCYYRAIEFAIANRIARVEAGAQGEHKLARGYGPVTTWSAHFIVHPGLRAAVADYLLRERRHVERTGEALAEHTPFRKDGGISASSNPKAG